MSRRQDSSCCFCHPSFAHKKCVTVCPVTVGDMQEDRNGDGNIADKDEEGISTVC